MLIFELAQKLFPTPYISIRINTGKHPLLMLLTERNWHDVFSLYERMYCIAHAIAKYSHLSTKMVCSVSSVFPEMHAEVQKWKKYFSMHTYSLLRHRNPSFQRKWCSSSKLFRLVAIANWAWMFWHTLFSDVDVGLLTLPVWKEFQCSCKIKLFHDYVWRHTTLHCCSWSLVGVWVAVEIWVRILHSKSATRI